MLTIITSSRIWHPTTTTVDSVYKGVVFSVTNTRCRYVQTRIVADVIPLSVVPALRDPKGNSRDRADHSTFPSTMSLTSTSNIKSQLTTALGDKGALYFSIFQHYLKASISRQEFEDQVRECLDTPHLRASFHRSSKRDSCAHIGTLLYSATAQLTCDIFVRHHLTSQTTTACPTPAPKACTT